MATNIKWNVGDPVYSPTEEGIKGIVVGVNEKDGTIEVRPGSRVLSSSPISKEIVTADKQREQIKRAEKSLTEIEKKNQDILKQQRLLQSKVKEVKSMHERLNNIRNELEKITNNEQKSKLENEKFVVDKQIKEYQREIQEYNKIIERYKNAIDIKKQKINEFDKEGRGMIRPTKFKSDSLYQTEAEVKKIRKERGYIINEFGMYVEPSKAPHTTSENTSKLKTKLQEMKRVGAAKKDIEREVKQYEKEIEGINKNIPRRGSGKISDNGEIPATYISPSQLSSKKIAYIPMKLNTTGIDPKTGEQTHKYSFTGTHANQYKSAYNENEIISVTQLGKILTGDGIKKMKEQEEIYKQKEENQTITGPEIKKYEKLKNDLARIDSAGKYGTSFHKTIELLEKNKADVSNDDLLLKFIENVIESENLDLGKGYKYNGKIIKRNKQDLVKDVQAYLKLKKDIGIGDVAGSEMSLGGAINIGGKTRLIGGTLDQMFLTGKYGIRDLKATSDVKSEYGLQVSLLAKMLRSAGFDAPKGLGISRIYKGQAYSEDFEEISDDLMVKILESAFEVVDAKTEEAKIKAQKRGRELLGSGGRIYQINKKIDEKSGIEYTTYNGKALGSMGKIKDYETEEDAINRILDLYSSIKNNPKVLSGFLSSLYNTEKYEGDNQNSIFHLSGPVFDKVREKIKSGYNIPVSQAYFGQKTFTTNEGEEVSAPSFGGLFASEVAKRYNITLQQSGEETAEKYVRAVLKKIDEAIGQEEHSLEDFVTGKIAERFYNSLIEKSNAFNNTKGFRNINSFINRYMTQSIGGEGQDRPEYEQEYSAILESQRRGEIAHQTIEYLRKQMNTSEIGGFTEVLNDIKTEVDKGVPSDIIFKEYGNKLKQLYSSLGFIKETMNDAIKSLGVESEFDKYGSQETVNLSQEIIESIVDFKSKLINTIKNFGISQNISDNIINKVKESLSLDKKDTSEIAVWRLSRAIGISDYMDDTLSKSMEAGNKVSNTPLSKDYYIKNLLSKQGNLQYRDSKNFKELFLNYNADGAQGMIAFLKDFVGGKFTYESQEMNQLRTQIESLMRAYGDDILVDISTMLSDILYNDKGEFDLSRRFSSFKKGGANYNILSGKGVGFYSSQEDDGKNDNILTKEEKDYINKIKETNYSNKINRHLNLQTELFSGYTPEKIKEWDSIDKEISSLEKDIEPLRKNAFFSYYKGYVNSPEKNNIYFKEKNAYLKNLEERQKIQEESDKNEMAIIAARETSQKELEANKIKALDGNIFMTGYFPGRNKNDKAIGPLTYQITREEAKGLNSNSWVKRDDGVDFIVSEISDSILPFQKKTKDGIVNATIDDYTQFQFKKKIEQEEIKNNKLEPTEKNIETKEVNINSDNVGMIDNDDNKLQELSTYSSNDEIVNKEKITKEEKEAQKVYNEYLKEYYRIEKKIADLKEDQKRGKALGEDTGGISRKIRGLRGYETRIKNMAKKELGEEQYAEFSKEDVENAYRDKLQRELAMHTADKKAGRKAYIEEEQAAQKAADKKKKEAEEAEKLTEAQKVYNEYLKEEKNILDEITKLEKQEGVLISESKDPSEIQNKMSALKDRLDIRRRDYAGYIANSELFNQVENSKQTQEIREKNKRERDYAERVNLGSIDESVIQDYNQYLKERLTLEDKIYQAELKSNTTMGKERFAYEKYLGLLKIELSDLDKKNEKLGEAAAIASGMKPENYTQLESYKKYQQELALVQARRAAGNKGQRTIRDVISRDLSMVGMRFMNFGMISRLMSKLPQSLNKVKQSTMQLEQALMNLRVVTGYNREEGEALLVTYNKLSKELGATTVEVANAADAWLRQGYDVADAENLIVASMKLSKLGKIDSAQATKSLTSALKAYKMEASSAISIVDKLTKVDMEAAVSAGEISEGLARVSTSAQLAGLSIDETIGMLSAIGEVTQRDMGSVGDALRTMLSRYGNVKAGVFKSMGLDDDGETSENINDIEKVLGKIGIRIRDSKMEMRDVSDVLDEVAEKWSGFDTVTKNAIATAFGGVRQRENFNVLMEHYDRVKELTEESAKSAGTADQKYEAYMDSMEAATKRLENAWESFTMKLESSKALRYTSQWLATIVENMDKLVPLAITLLTTLNSSKIIGFFTGGMSGKGSGFSNLFNTMFGMNWKMTRDTETGKVLYQQTAKDSWLGRIYAGVQQIANNTGISAQHDSGETVSNTVSQGTVWNRKYYKQQKNYYKQYKKIKLQDWNVSGEIWDTNTHSYIPDSDAKNLREFRAYQSALNKQRATQGGMAAGIAVLGRLAQTKQVGSGGVSGLLSKAFGTEGQSVQEDTIDKIAGVTLTGVGAGVGAAFFGPIGGMIGQMVGDGISDLFAYIKHRDELEMKQRVQEAKDRMTVLNNIKDVVKNNNDLMSKRAFDTEDYQKLETYFDSLKQYMSDYVGKRGNQKDFIESVLKGSNLAEDWTDVKDIYSLTEKLYSATSDIRTNVQKQLEIQQSKDYLKSLEESKEEIDYNNQKLLSKDIRYYNKQGHVAYDYIRESSISGAIEKVKSIIDENEKKRYTTNKFTGKPVENINVANHLKSLNEYYQQLQEAYDKEKEIEEKIINARIVPAYLSSGILDMTQRQMSDVTMEGLVQRVANSIGEESRNEEGLIKETYRTLIEKMIKSDSTFSILLRGGTSTLSEILGDAGEFEKKAKEKEFDYNDIKSQIEKGELIDDETEKLFYAADPTRIQNFAKAWNMTTKSLKEFAKIYPELTQALGMMSTSEIKDYFSDFHTILDDLFEDATIEAQNFEKVLDKYPSLLNDIFKDGKDISKMIETISDKVLKMENVAIANSVVSSLKDNIQFFENMIENNTNFDETFFDTIGNSNTISQVLEALSISNLDKETKDKYMDEIQKYMNKVIKLDYEDPMLKKAIEFQTNSMEKQIDMYQEQLEALEKINEQHKKEMEWYKAVDALENAKKNKNAVYREGVGWTYEANEDNIISALEKIEDVRIEKQKESIQREIDMINTQKKILDNLENNKNLETIANSLGILTGETGTSSIAHLVDAFQHQYLSINPYTGEISYSAGINSDGSIKTVTAQAGGIKGYFNSLDEEKKTAITNAKSIINEYNSSTNPSEDLEKKAKEARANVINNYNVNDNDDELKLSSVKDRLIKFAVDYQINKFNKYDGFMKNNIDELSKSAAALIDTMTKEEIHDQLETLKNEIQDDKIKQEIEYLSKYYASGTFSSKGGLSLINELGTEAIITPQGTITSLPSNTGIIPADITKNLWSLGEVAPMLIAQLKTLDAKNLTSNIGNNTYEEGQYIDHLIMNIYPTKDYDMDKLLNEARAKARLSRNNQ